VKAVPSLQAEWIVFSFSRSKESLSFEVILNPPISYRGVEVNPRSIKHMLENAFDLYCNRGRIQLTCIRHDQEGRAMEYREVSQIYRNMTEFDLRKLRAKKVCAIERLRNFYTYFGKRDIQRLQFQIDRIDAELRCREAQSSFFE